MRKKIKYFIDKIVLLVLKNKKIKNYLFRRISKDHIDRSIDILRCIRDKDFIIIDIGACEGQENDTTQRYSRAFPNNIIYAFEPCSISYNKLLINLKEKSNVKTFNTALSNYKGESKLYITNTLSSSSLLKTDENEILKLEKNISNRVGDSKNYEIINVDRLDNIFLNNKIGILKIDTQGTELSVLQGADNILDNIYIILLENNNHSSYIDSSKYYEIDEFLRKRNFELYDIIPSMYSGVKLYEWDSIYINKKAEFV